MRILHAGMCATGMTNINGQQKAFMENFSDYDELNCGDPNFNQRLIDICQSKKFDIVFLQIQTPNIITEETAIAVKNTGAFVVNFTGDVRYPIPQWYYDIGKHIDLTLFSNMTDVLKMNSDGVAAEYLDIGYDPEIFKPDVDQPWEYDIVFMGNNYEDLFPLSRFRMDIVSEMKKHFGDRFKVFGNGWKSCDGSFTHSQHEEASIYQKTKIAINCSHFNYAQYSSDRMLRIMGSGVFCLNHRYPEVELKFEDGKHLVNWESISELIEKCEYFLNNDAERFQIAMEGQKRIAKIGTFDAMARNLVKIHNTYK